MTGRPTKAERVLVTRDDILRAGGVKAALDEAHSAASIAMMPRSITAYEAEGGGQSEEDGGAVMVQIVVGDEAELREAIGAGAEAVLLERVSTAEAQRLGEIARELRTDCVVEVPRVHGVGNDRISAGLEET